MSKQFLYECQNCGFQWKSKRILSDFDRGCPNPNCNEVLMKLVAQLPKEDIYENYSREQIIDLLKKVDKAIHGNDEERKSFKRDIATVQVVEDLFGYVLKKMKVQVKCKLAKQDTCNCPSCQIAKMREHAEDIAKEIFK